MTSQQRAKEALAELDLAAGSQLDPSPEFYVDLTDFLSTQTIETIREALQMMAENEEERIVYLTPEERLLMQKQYNQIMTKKLYAEINAAKEGA